jgi:hypothetical protein
MNNCLNKVYTNNRNKEYLKVITIPSTRNRIIISSKKLENNN